MISRVSFGARSLDRYNTISTSVTVFYHVVYIQPPLIKQCGAQAKTESSEQAQPLQSNPQETDAD